MSGAALTDKAVVADRPPVIVLLYHQVADLDGDPQRLAVSPIHFAEQLKVIRQMARPTRLSELLEPPGTPNDRPRIVITFDDGYADNLTHAKPLLETHDVPATVFVTSGQIGAAREFWWDELDQVILRSAALPAKLKLRVGGETIRWRWEQGVAPSAFDLHPGWTIEDDDRDPRHALYRVLCGTFRRADAASRRRALDAITEWAGVKPVLRPNWRVLTAGGLLRLAASDAIEIGAHTVTHTMLTALRLVEQRREVRQSKAALEQILGRPVRSFSYPFGTPSAYNDATLSAVREAGFACACSNVEGLVCRGASVHELPRFVVRDWDGEVFSRRLRTWLKPCPGAVRIADQAVGELRGTVRCYSRV